MTQQTLMHRAEEYGQSRELKTPEVGAHTFMAAIESVALGGAGSLAVVVFQGVQGDMTWGTIGTAAATGVIVGGFSFAFHVSQNFGELRDGLRSWRSIETFAPPEPQHEQPRWRSPIPIIRKGDVQLLDMNEKPWLPQPERQPTLTPQRVLEILGASIENDGSFSRRTITGLRLSDGGKVTRGMWHEMCAWLHKVGVLRQDTQGSYCLPHQIRCIDDLFIQLPGLAQLGGPGGQRAGLGTSNTQPAQSLDGEVVETLAKRRQQRWLKCECDVKLYRADE